MNEVKEKEVSVEETSNQIIPHQIESVNEHLDIDLWIETRKEFKTKVGSIMLDGSDYHVIQGKKSLAKGGAEKIASIFGWSAQFAKDTEALEMLGELKGLVALVCNLTDRSGRIVGQGRGAASLAKNSNDPNKTLKMAQKSAFIDAVLRASGLSDIYTQDLEDMTEVNHTPVTPKRTFSATPKPTTPDLFKDYEKQITEVTTLPKLEEIYRQVATLTKGKRIDKFKSEMLIELIKAKKSELEAPPDLEDKKEIVLDVDVSDIN